MKHGHCRRVGGRNMSPTFKAWQNMRARCEKPSNPSYRYYSERGITVCDRWSSFENFLVDMGEKPEGMTLDRRNNALGYSQENCRWATASQQQYNTRMTVGSPELVRVVRRCIAFGMKQREIADTIGLKKSYVADISAGRRA